MRSKEPARGRTDSPELSEELRASYTRAVYRVDFPAAPVFLEVGAPSPALDGWLAANGETCFAFLSAANPGSVTLADAENRRRHERLVARLRAGGFTPVAGESFAATSGAWREASLLVGGMAREAAIRLASEFGQAALLCGEIGGPVELVPAAGPAGELRR